MVVGEPPTEVASTVPTPSAKIARPMTGSRSRLVMAATALTCPAFSAMSAMTAGSTSRLKLTEKLGAVNDGRPIQSAAPTEAKLMRSCVLTTPAPSGLVIGPDTTSSTIDST